MYIKSNKYQILGISLEEKNCSFHSLNTTNKKVKNVKKKQQKNPPTASVYQTTKTKCILFYFLTPGNKAVFYPAESDRAPPQQGVSSLPVTVREARPVPPEAGLLPHAEAAV